MRREETDELGAGCAPALVDQVVARPVDRPGQQDLLVCKVSLDFHFVYVYVFDLFWFVAY